MVLNYIIILKLYFWNILEQKYVHKDHDWWNQVLSHRIRWQRHIYNPVEHLPTRQDYVPRTSWRRPWKTSWRLRTSPYGPVCNTKGRICSGTSMGCAQDVNLTIIHQNEFLRIFKNNLIRPILVLLWSGTFQPQEDH